MDCNQCAENLTAYLDSELSASEAEEVRSHLQACAACAEELQSLRKASEYIESRIREITPGIDAWKIVEERISSAQVPRRQFGFFPLRWHVAATMLVVFGIFGFGYMQYRQNEKRSLDSYIEKYARERDARLRTAALLTRSEDSVEVREFYESNPFIEANPAPVDNPFLMEGR